ncbi:MAG: DUF1905 domain-containing protein [Chitinophagales bacterium]|nr:DUF1905 domain-containing protein [Chitinophagales bacterium]
MKPIKGKQILEQLGQHKGSYYYIDVAATVVAKMPKQKATRLVCDIDGKLSYSCGLNHKGDGNFFIIISGKNLKTLGKKTGDTITYTLTEDPNPLGVAMPEVLEALLAQDDDCRKIFDSYTDGRKRSLIHIVNGVKDIDKKVQTALNFLSGKIVPGRRKA